MSCKALGIAIKLTFEGNNQLMNAETWLCAAVVLACVVTQMNYLNKALDVFNTAVVTPIYYVMFTTLTLTASSIMFKDYVHQSTKEVISQLCGFVTILAGVFVLHVTKDVEMGGMGAPGSSGKRSRQQRSTHKSDGTDDEGSGSAAGKGINMMDMRVNMPRQLSAGLL